MIIMTMEETVGYRCIECGAGVKNLYTNYSSSKSQIKVLHCESCQSVADKYIEYDPIIVLLDTLLLQRPAYRHLIFNTTFKPLWKYVSLLCICDAFTKLIQERAKIGDLFDPSLSSGSKFDMVHLYVVNYLLSASEIASFLVCVSFILVLHNFIVYGSMKSLSCFVIIKAIMMGNLGRISAIPAFLWGQSYSFFFLRICQMYVGFTSFQSLSVIVPGRFNIIVSVTAICFGMLVKVMLSKWIVDILDISSIWPESL